MGDSGVGELLGRVALFADLPDRLRQEVAAGLRTVQVPAGSWLFRQDDAGDSLFVLRSGRLELIREGPPPAEVIGLVAPGQALGELAVLTGRRRALSARAIRDSEVVCLERDHILRLLEESPEFADGLISVLGGHIRETARHVRSAGSRAGVITIAGADGGGLPADLGDHITSAFPDPDLVRCLDGSEVVGDGRAGDELVAEYGALLLRHERDTRLVVLLAGPWQSSSAWDRFCMRHADRLLVLAAPETPLPFADEAQPLAGCDLAFWGAPSTPGTVARWLDRVAARSHHFVDPENCAETIGRALRRLTGRAVGVVVSGGGAPALASIGVLATLLERGVPVDRVGGVSVGAFVAALFAAGQSPDEIVETCRRELIGAHLFADYRVSRSSLIAGRRARAMLERAVGSARIEELTRDFFCVSADLIAAELVVHRRGALTGALAATMTLPGLMPPVAEGSRLLVDGSVLNGLPVHVMSERTEGPVVAVDVVERTWGGASGHRRFRLVDTIGRSVALAGTGEVEAERLAARVVVEPDGLGAGQLAFDRLDALVASGRAAAARVLDNAPDLFSAPAGG